MKKKLLYLLLAFISMNSYAKDDATKGALPIVEEGKQLYKSEMASWYGTDLFLEHHKDRSSVGGYFSYVDKDSARCIFFSKAESPKVIGTISFDTTYSIENALVDLSERDFSNNEKDLYALRKIALKEINTDTLFKTYKNTSLNLIPLINGQGRKVYVLTGPQKTGVVIFGNDYLITYDKNNKLTEKKQLHKNIIPIFYDEKNVSAETMHSHLPETGEYITATDVCTLMLYEKFANWKTHTVISRQYLNIWDCSTNKLEVIPRETAKNIK